MLTMSGRIGWIRASDLLVWFGSVWFRALWYRGALVWLGRSLVLGALVKAQDLEKQRGREKESLVPHKLVVTDFEVTCMFGN